LLIVKHCFGVNNILVSSKAMFRIRVIMAWMGRCHKCKSKLQTQYVDYNVWFCLLNLPKKISLSRRLLMSSAWVTSFFLPQLKLEIFFAQIGIFLSQTIYFYFLSFKCI
jgi:hypothetical protein